MTKQPTDAAPWRFLKRDGTFNIERKGVLRGMVWDAYHFSLSTSWIGVVALLFAGYFSVNLLFGLAYFACGPDALDGVRAATEGARFLQCFFFSVQTLATIGYGHISPATLTTNFIVTIEAIVGALCLAMATGLVYARFSKPTARVVFSNHALIGPHDGVPSLVFRMANSRLNQIVDAQVSVTLVRNETTKEGQHYRNLIDLPLERSRSALFAMTWTIVHPIAPDSPLHGATRESLLEDHSEIMVTLVGIDDTLSDTIHARFSYTAHDLIWKGSFRDMITRAPSGKLRVDLRKIHEVEGHA